jgi:DNA ligase-1
LVSSSLLREWVSEKMNFPSWIVEECYAFVGDLAETISLLTPNAEVENFPDLASLMEEYLHLLSLEGVVEKKSWIFSNWERMGPTQRWIFNKILTGGFRMGVSQKLVVKAIARTFSLPEETITHRLLGKWNPNETFWNKLIGPNMQLPPSHPYPFFLANTWEGKLPINDFLVELKWDGIRCMAIKRNDEVFLWSRGEELVNQQFPEIELKLMQLPNGTVLDGEVLPGTKVGLADFSQLQVRLGRKKVSSKMMETHPVFFRAYDLLEWKGNDVRSLPLWERKKLLQESGWEDISQFWKVNDEVELEKERIRSSEFRAEGLMLKHQDSEYGVGRTKGSWWKFKRDPWSIDAVLLYAQAGHGQRANLFTDYTLAVWDEDRLLPFAKAYSGLTKEEILEVDRFIKANTLERFGPVRTVKPELVFEIGFEGISESKRHKSGVAVRFPRILRWRKDKLAGEANTIQDLRAMIR